MIKDSIYCSFAGVDLSTLGLINGMVGESGLATESLMGSRKINEIKVKYNDIPYFGNMERECLQIPVQFCFLEPWNDDLIRKVVQLFGNQTNYQPLTFSENPSRIYNAIVINDSNILHNCLKSGYITLIFKTDSPYSYSDYDTSLLYDLTNTGSQLIEINNVGDVLIQPEFSITKMNGSGGIKITNQTNGNELFEFYGESVGKNRITFNNSVYDGEQVIIDNAIYEMVLNSKRTLLANRNKIDLTEGNIINTPCSTKNANVTMNFSNSEYINDGDTFQIGSNIFEFDNNNIVTSSNIKIDFTEFNVNALGGFTLNNRVYPNDQIQISSNRIYNFETGTTSDIIKCPNSNQILDYMSSNLLELQGSDKYNIIINSTRNSDARTGVRICQVLNSNYVRLLKIKDASESVWRIDYSKGIDADITGQVAGDTIEIYTGGATNTDMNREKTASGNGSDMYLTNVDGIVAGSSIFMWRVDDYGITIGAKGATYIEFHRVIDVDVANLKITLDSSLTKSVTLHLTNPKQFLDTYTIFTRTSTLTAQASDITNTNDTILVDNNAVLVTGLQNTVTNIIKAINVDKVSDSATDTTKMKIFSHNIISNNSLVINTIRDATITGIRYAEPIDSNNILLYGMVSNAKIIKGITGQIAGDIVKVYNKVIADNTLKIIKYDDSTKAISVNRDITGLVKINDIVQIGYYTNADKFNLQTVFRLITGITKNIINLDNSLPDFDVTSLQLELAIGSSNMYVNGYPITFYSFSSTRIIDDSVLVDGANVIYSANMVQNEKVSASVNILNKQQVVLKARNAGIEGNKIPVLVNHMENSSDNQFVRIDDRTKSIIFLYGGNMAKGSDIVAKVVGIINANNDINNVESVFATTTVGSNTAIIKCNTGGSYFNNLIISQSNCTCVSFSKIALDGGIDPTKQECANALYNSLFTSSDWVSGTTYYVGKLVNYNGLVYVCTTQNNDTSFMLSDWQVYNRFTANYSGIWYNYIDFVSTIYEGHIYVNTTCFNAKWSYNEFDGILDALKDGEQVWIDCDSQVIKSNLDNTYRYKNCNLNWLKLVLGTNTLKIEGDCKIQFRYRYKFLN